MRPSLRVVLALLATLSMALCAGGCSNVPSASSGSIPRYTASGSIVTGDSNMPLANVLITVRPFGTTLSDSAGKWAKSGMMPVSSGGVMVEPFHEGYLFEPCVHYSDYNQWGRQEGLDFVAWPKSPQPLIATCYGQYSTAIEVLNPDGHGSQWLHWVSRFLRTPYSVSWSPAHDGFAFTYDGDIFTSDLEGHVYRLTSNKLFNETPVWSPLGDNIAFSTRTWGCQQWYDYQTDICVMSADGRGARRLTFEQKHNTSPRWSPHGSEIVFISQTDTYPTKWQLRTVNPYTYEETVLYESDLTISAIDWSYDGSTIAMSLAKPGSGSKLLLLPVGQEKARELEIDGYSCTDIAWSPNGTEIALTGCRASLTIVNVASGNIRTLGDYGSIFYAVDW